MLPLLTDPDSTVRVAAAFALGLLRDPAGARPLMDRITGSPALDGPTAVEAITALAKIGGREVGAFFEGILAGSVVPTVEDRRPLVSQVVLESWRLGRDAPVVSLLPFLEDTSVGLRWRAAYTLGRLRAPAAGNRLSVALRDPEGIVRAMAARALTRSYADTAGLASKTVAQLLARAAADANAQVKINALRSLAGFEDSTLASEVVPLLDDPLPNVQVQAATTAGELGGAEAARGSRAGRGRQPSLRRAARGAGRTREGRYGRLHVGVGPLAKQRRLARASRGGGGHRDRRSGPAAVVPLGSRPQGDRGRTAGLVGGGGGPRPGPDGRGPPAGPARRRRRPERGRRCAEPGGGPGGSDGTGGLPTAAPARDSFPDAAFAALGAIQAIGGSSAEARARVAEEFVSSAPRPDDYLVRRWAEENWPELAARWGRAAPIATGRSAQDYRDLVRRFIVAPDSVARPKVIIETDQRGPMEVELLGPEAPMTVANFLRLVDRRFFDGNRWHRVVPNFVVQDGDPRGDGFGGPGGAIRDEINRHRYDGPMLGMALSGPDTGSSQWFITLSPQPHLDGTYTVFGRVTGGSRASRGSRRAM